MVHYRDWLVGHYWIWKRKYGNKQIDGMSHLKPLRPKQVLFFFILEASPPFRHPTLTAPTQSPTPADRDRSAR